MLKRDRLLAALKGQPVDRPPAWIMRQAGRYLPEFRAIRAKHSFSEVCRTPELAREVTLQPLRRFDFDAGIIFSDILIVPEALGMRVDYAEGGPKLEGLIVEGADVARLGPVPDAPTAFAFLAEAIRLTCAEVGPDFPILGFAGAPYTLASYMTEGGGGGKTYSRLRRMAFADPGAYEALMGRLSDTVIELLKLQIRAGAAAVQLFDTHGGHMAPHDYARFVLPWLKTITTALRPSGAPLVYYLQGGRDHYALAATAGFDALSVDWRMPLTTVRELAPGLGLQGNLDPARLYGSAESITAEVERIYSETGGRGHVFNLGHGILPDIPIAGVAAFLAAVHSLAPRFMGAGR